MSARPIWEYMTQSSATNPDGLDFNDHGKALVRWWLSSRCQSEPCTRRSAFNPVRHLPILPYIFLHQWHDDLKINCRLSGTKVDELIGVNFTGRNVFDATNQAYRDDIKAIFYNVRDLPCGAIINRNALREDGNVCRLKSLMLPLVNDDLEPKFIIGVADAYLDFAPSETPPKVVELFSSINECSYIDLGAGVPEA
jgi:hypothetical protein